MSMNVSCSRFPCSWNGFGCISIGCPNNMEERTFVTLPAQPAPSYQMGCVCPPTSEQTCESPICPRKNHLKATGAA